MDTHELRHILFHHCLDEMNARKALIIKKITEANISAQEDVKSSAGDKFETHRAMMHLEAELLTRQLDELESLSVNLRLEKYTLDLPISVGSVIETSHGNFYLMISAAPCEIDARLYHCISPDSPLGIAFLGLEEGDGFDHPTLDDWVEIYHLK